ncbi:hypothetical protein [Gordonia sp. CPCC 205333]|uniref:hypothetical protein n=1 Tax=Gordonia sp. CPCC 205333 TaxID=3140790 RepID=UPI003AF3E785
MQLQTAAAESVVHHAREADAAHELQPGLLFRAFTINDTDVVIAAGNVLDPVGFDGGDAGGRV